MAIKSNADIFESLGYPWTTPGDMDERRTVVERLSPTHRKIVLANNKMNTRLARLGLSSRPVAPLSRLRSETVDIGDPELDQFTRAKIAPVRREMKSETRPDKEATVQRRTACAVQQMKAKLFALKHRGFK